MKRLILCSILAMVLILLCAANANAGGQYNPACNCVPSDNNAMNTSVDTCGFHFFDTPCNFYSTSPGFSPQLKEDRRLYTKNRIHIYFKVEAIPLPSFPLDSVVIVPWTAIDSQYPQIRDGFRSIEQRFGHFTLQTVLPQGSNNDFVLHFDNYVNGFDIEDSLNAIPLTIGVFTGVFDFLSNVNDEVLHGNQMIISSFHEITIPVQGKTTVELYSINGVLLQHFTESNTTITFDVSAFSTGLYFLKINNTYRKLFLQR